MSDPREYLNRHALLDVIVQPPFEELRERARDRRRRRTSFLGLALVLAVTGFGVPVLFTQPAQPPGPPAPDSRPALPRTGSHFLDTRNGVLLYANEAPPGQTSCGARIRVTDDGGRSWSGPRPVPCHTDRHTVLMLGARTLLFFDGDGEIHFSRDAGRTWQPHSAETVTADRVPAWAQVTHDCVGLDTCANPQLRWYDPATGAQAVLRTGPDLEKVLGEPTWGRDQSLWVPGQMADGRYAVAVSSDQGRTWRIRRIGLDVHPNDDQPCPLSVATRDGRTAYAVCDGLTLDNVLFRTSDGGQTWQRVTTKADPHSPYNWMSAYVAADGTLVLETSGHASRWQASRDGGLSVTPLTDFPNDAMVVVLPDGYLRYGTPEESIHVSGDGLHWREVKLP